MFNLLRSLYLDFNPVFDRMVIGVILVFIFAYVARAADAFIRFFFGLRGSDSGLVAEVFYFVIAFIGTYLGFYYIFTPATAQELLAAFTVGVGFALRPLILSVAAGLSVHAQGRIGIGDRLEFHKSGVGGSVEEMSLTRVVLRGDGGKIVLSNGHLVEEPFTIVKRRA